MGGVFVDSCEKVKSLPLSTLTPRGIVCGFGADTVTRGGVVVEHCVLYFQTLYICGLELSQLITNRLALYTYILGLGVGFLGLR